MDNRRAVQVISLAKFQRRERVAKARRLIEVRCPLVHIPEEQPCLYIFQDRFHRVLPCPFDLSQGVLIFDN